MKDQLITKGKDLLKQQLQAYGVGSKGEGNFLPTSLSDGINRYQLSIEGLSSPLSVLSVQGYEHLSEPWRYIIQFNAQHGLTMEQVLSEKAVFVLAPPGSISALSDVAGRLSNELMSAFNAFGGMFSDKIGSAVRSPVAGFSVNNVTRIADKASGFLNGVGRLSGSVKSGLSSLSSFSNMANSFTGQEGESRTFYGVVTEFSQLATSADESRYEIILSPRLALLANTQGCTIYQTKTVPQVVEAILRKHDLTGVDFRFELTDTYPVKEYITQWQESDLTFIRRLLADSGIWFRFETHTRHDCDVVVFGDSEQQYQDGASVNYRQPSGQYDDGVECVWDMSIARKTVPQSVLTQDYNYCNALSGMVVESNNAQKDNSTRGQQYLYGEHYLERGETVNNSNIQDTLLSQFSNQQLDIEESVSAIHYPSGIVANVAGNTESSLSLGDANHRDLDEPISVGQGSWYGRLRHQRWMTEQITITGKTTLSALLPGDILTVSNSPLSEVTQGMLIVAIETQGDRQQAYHIHFTAIPYDILRPYRPALVPWPTISGTIPARVTSPDNDTYGYLDTQGRYRVKMDFDLNDSWRKGEESQWVRLAKPYAGETYGMHFPLIDGTEVAIAFTGGNPDRPYIAHGMHDSRHPDLVTAQNHKRNVIRTPANNKLRMDDERGKEHIKVATEYGKTQLNMGHLVDAERKQRGEGFELRTDEWGSIRAAKGMFISADAQGAAKGLSREMAPALQLLQQAVSEMKLLSEMASAAEARAIEFRQQEQLMNERLQDLQRAVLLASAPDGMALASGHNLHFSATDDIHTTAGGNIESGAMGHYNVAASESITLFAQQNGIELVTAGENVVIQARDGDINLTSNATTRITSATERVEVVAAKEILLTSGGAYIRIADGNISVHAPKQVSIKGSAHVFDGPTSLSVDLPTFGSMGFKKSFNFRGLEQESAISSMAHSLFHVGTLRDETSDTAGVSPEIEDRNPSKIDLHLDWEGFLDSLDEE
ncbi:Uncharacterized protein conserved in bacteria [Pragia fontium]|uniref:type VI secretion system Vgr family protein n=1 Tax=Pragia fontium TaxID=82985 RepID=UPI000DFAA031|nr:type VI secretion system Vgr family protein [Pragia fontium]SUB81664.1 Uncharacterized protein conserved in bacteria [Pragia fontium]